MTGRRMLQDVPQHQRSQRRPDWSSFALLASPLQRPLEAAFQLHAVAMPTRVVWAALQPPPGWKRSSLEDLRSRAVVLHADGCTHTSRYALHSFRSFIAPPLSLRPPSTNPNPEEASGSIRRFLNHQPAYRRHKFDLFPSFPSIFSVVLRLFVRLFVSWRRERVNV